MVFLKEISARNTRIYARKGIFGSVVPDWRTHERKNNRVETCEGGESGRRYLSEMGSAGIRWDARQDRAFTGWEDGICRSKGSWEEGEAIAEVKA